MIFNKRFGIDLFPFVLETVISPQFFQDTENSQQQETEILTSQTEIFLVCLGIFRFFFCPVPPSGFQPSSKAASQGFVKQHCQNSKPWKRLILKRIMSDICLFWNSPLYSSLRHRFIFFYYNICLCLLNCQELNWQVCVVSGRTDGQLCRFMSRKVETAQMSSSF